MTASSSSSSASSGLRPWQVDWKHPKWETTITAATKKEKDDNDKAKTSSSSSSSSWIVGSTSARVSAGELPEDLLSKILLQQQQQQQQKTDNDEIVKEEEEEEDVPSTPRPPLRPLITTTTTTTNNDFTLTVTLLSKTPSSTSASEILLEILQEEEEEESSTSSLRVVHSKRLLWPETVLDQRPNNTEPEHDYNIDNNDDDDNDDDDTDTATNVTTMSKNLTFWRDIVLASWLPSFSEEKEEKNKKKQQHKQRPSKGIVSATLCRSYRTASKNNNDGDIPNTINDIDAIANANDALDTIARMGLGMEAITMDTNNTTTTTTTNMPKSNSAGSFSSAGAGVTTTTTNNDDDDNNNNNNNKNNNNNNKRNYQRGGSSLSEIQPEDENELAPLYLTCVTARGFVAVYSPMDLLLSSSEQQQQRSQRRRQRQEQPQQQDDDGKRRQSSSILLPIGDYDKDEIVHDAMTLLFLGNDLYSKLQEVWKPLCQPLHSTTISILEDDNDEGNRGMNNNKSGDGSSSSSDGDNGSDEDEEDYDDDGEKETKDDNDDDDDNDNDKKVSALDGPKKTPNQPKRSFKKQKQKEKQHFWDAALWNPLLEAWTIPHRTKQNNVTNVQTAGRSLVVFGKGVSTTTTTTTVTTTVEEEEEEDDDEEEESPWWTPDEDEDGEVHDLPDITQDDLTTKRPWWAASGELEDPSLKETMESKSTKKGSTTEKKKTKTSPPPPRKKKKKQKTTQKTITTTHKKDGGFITFLSMTHWSETRTLFLPFVPKSISYIADWKGMELVLVIGDHDAWAIRMDVSFRPVLLGEEEEKMIVTSGGGDESSSPMGTGIASTAAVANASSSAADAALPQVQRPGIWVRRFQALPVYLPSQQQYQQQTVATVAASNKSKSNKKNNNKGPSSRLLCGSSDAVYPPALMELYTEETTAPAEQHGGLLLLRTLRTITSTGRIETGHAPGHVARIPESNDTLLLANDSTCSYIGQGWSLFGTQHCMYWICWEGATASRGVAFVEAFAEHAPESTFPTTTKTTTKVMGCFVSNVLPLESNNGAAIGGVSSRYQHHHHQQHRRGLSNSSIMRLPFTEPYESASLTATATMGGGSHHAGATNTNNSTAGNTLPEGDDIVVEALESISAFSFRGEDLLSPEQSSSFVDREASKTISHREKSARLLRQCSSWAQLESTRDNRLVLERQVPVLSLRFGNTLTSQRILTLRHLTVFNGPATPFQQVLSWLCNRRDYFTAASIALDLLNDPQSLYHLWKHAEKIDEEDEQNKLDGLLDGIIPVKKTVDFDEQQQYDQQQPADPILIQLADMTVGCLTKGGFALSKTLKSFLHNDKNYDPARACLMLAATTANAVSDDPSSIKDAMGIEVDDATDQNNIDKLLWPVQCMLQIGVSRDYLSTCLVLLNVTIPDELRRRPRHGTMKITTPSMALTKSLVTLILTCDDPDATDYLLGLVDDQSGGRFWDSLDHETRLELSLIGIDNKYLLLKEPEVRSWVRNELHNVLKDTTAETNLPTDWLRELAVACLHNAGCDIPGFVLDPNNASTSVSESSSDIDIVDDNVDGLEQHKVEIVETRNTLIAGGGGRGLDFDLLIPCLLLLQNRRAEWNGNGEYVSTQSLLDASCYLAGRDTKRNQDDDDEEEEPLFDGPTVMRGCALAGNVRAAANLVGGTNGFVLSCCDILMVEMQVSMEDAEHFILEDRMSLDYIVEKSERFQLSNFELTDSHRGLLWMLDEHVLSIRTFGDFETIHLRGRVDPVFCSRSIFRAWLCLTYSVREEGSAWLVKWLRGRLEIRDASIGGGPPSPSPYRLACAALVRALVWPSRPGISADDAIASGQMLGQLLGLENKFLLELSNSCCGLVESVPFEVAEEIVRLSEMPGGSNITAAAVLGGISR